MVEDGTWTGDLPASDQLVEVFVSKSVWHAYYQKLFPEVSRHPLLLKWLMRENDAPSNLELFGKEKNLYKFSDLKEVLAWLAGDRNGKRKAKGSFDDGQHQKKKKDKKRVSSSGFE